MRTKAYRVELTAEERDQLEAMLRKGKAAARRARAPASADQGAIAM